STQTSTPTPQVDRLGSWKLESWTLTTSTQNANSQPPKLINLGVGSWRLAIGSERVLLDFLFLRLVSRDSQRTKEPAIVRADLELAALLLDRNGRRLLLRRRGHSRPGRRARLRAADE